MTKQRTVTVLLAIFAALLAANLIVNLPPQEATAQSHLKTAAQTHPAGPHVIQVEPGQHGLTRVYRLWSDGVIEEAVFQGVGGVCVTDQGPIGFGWQEIPETVPLPHVVNITRIYTQADTNVLLRLRSDGVVEQNFLSGTLGWCG